jgi:hypothetical protein
MSSISEARGRHRAPDTEDGLRIARLTDVERLGRHAEQDRQRERSDPGRDEDPA